MIGEVTDHGELRAFFDGEVVGAIPAGLLTEECPRYEVEQAPHAVAGCAGRRRQRRAEDAGCSSSTTSSSARAPSAGPGSTPPCCGSTGRAASPSRSTARRSASATRSAPGWQRRRWSAALNVACAGGEPLALTDCLNFGNPERPEIAWELAQRDRRASPAAARELGIPVVSGNVSLYNETGGRPIPPTPVVGCVGLVRDVTRIPSRWRRGDRVVLLRGEGAELVRFVWQNAHRFSLARHPTAVRSPRRRQPGAAIETGSPRPRAAA